MKKIKAQNRFIRYKFYSIYCIFLGMVTWSSLGTFMLVAKNDIGVTNIPIFEVMMFLAGLAGIQVAHAKIVSLRNSILMLIIIETLFLVLLYTLLKCESGSLAMSGVLVYMTSIFNLFSSKIVGENIRIYEDEHLTTKASKWGLRKIRKKQGTMSLVGGGLGAMIALIFLTYFQVNLITFTMTMLVLNVVQNFFEYFLWYKFLK